MMALEAEDIITTGEEKSSSSVVMIEKCATKIECINRSQQTCLGETNETDSNIGSSSQTYPDVEVTFQKQTDRNSQIDDGDEGISSYSELILVVYIPLVVLWFRRSMFGPANLVRTILVGQLMRFVFLDNISQWMSERLPPWLEVMLFQSSATSASSVTTILGSGTGKNDPHAWPPPAFTALALLTIFALVVHPDGLTWILLGKLRDAISAVFSAMGQSLEFLINDYGVFPTVIAATTLAAMLFIVFLVLRTLSPKKTKNNGSKHNNTLHNERKKKRKKGGNARHRREHHNNNNRSNRIKIPSQSHLREELENAPVVASPPSPIPSLPPSEVENDGLSPASKDAMDDTLVVPSFSEPSPSIGNNIENNLENSIENNIENDKCAEDVVSDEIPASDGMVKTKESRSRRRMMSGSTSDTTPLSDDHSCGSMSVRSFPSVSVNSNRSGGSSINKKSNKGSVSTPQRVKRNGTVTSPKLAERNSGKKNKSATVDSSSPSRWDALKPRHGKKGNNNHTNKDTDGNIIKKKQNQRQQQQQQQQQQRYNRGNSRRGHGVNGTGQARKGRQKKKSSTKERPMTNHNANATNLVPSSDSSLPRKNVRSGINEVSPIIASRQQNDRATLSKTSTDNPYISTDQPSSSSSPSTGFQNSTNVHGFERKNPDIFRRQDHVDNKFLVSTLSETAFAVPALSTQFGNRLEKASKSIISQQQDVTGLSGGFFPPARAVPSSSRFFDESAATGTTIQENPFDSKIKTFVSSNDNFVSRQQANLDSQIEADLQELGGQMAGSILDF